MNNLNHKKIFKISLIFSLEVTKQVSIQLNNLLMIAFSDNVIINIKY